MRIASPAELLPVALGRLTPLSLSLSLSPATSFGIIDMPTRLLVGILWWLTCFFRRFFFVSFSSFLSFYSFFLSFFVSVVVYRAEDVRLRRRTNFDWFVVRFFVSYVFFPVKSWPIIDRSVEGNIQENSFAGTANQTVPFSSLPVLLMKSSYRIVYSIKVRLPKFDWTPWAVSCYSIVIQ